MIGRSNLRFSMPAYAPPGLNQHVFLATLPQRPLCIRQIAKVRLWHQADIAIHWRLRAFRRIG
jgi:hypothetical protein